MERPVASAAETGARRATHVDVALYAGSAMFAWLVAAFSELPLQRSWGRLAVWTYLGGALVALLLTREHPRGRDRVILAIAVSIGATCVPLLAAASQRGGDETGGAAQSEVFIVEEAAAAVLSGRDPYAEEFTTGPLASRPRPTQAHVPYPPAMFLFGLPKAIAGPGLATDARVWFLIVSLAIAGPALRSMRTDPDGRLRSFQVLFVLPTGALLLATGGHDVPVLAALLAALVLADRDRTDAAGAVSGMALTMRQTAVLALPFLVSILPPGRRWHSLVWMSMPVLVLVVPFLLWDAGAFIEDTVLFPLGLGTGRSSASTPTLGSALIGLAPGARTLVTIGLVVGILASVVLLLRVRPPTTAAGASRRAASAFAVAIARGPAGRFGYLVYPISLAVWAIAFRAGVPGQTEDRALPHADPST